jgi:hypothetical protein
VDPVPDPLLRKSGSAGNQTQTSGSVVKNLDHRGDRNKLKVKAILLTKYRKKFLKTIQAARENNARGDLGLNGPNHIVFAKTFKAFVKKRK